MQLTAHRLHWQGSEQISTHGYGDTNRCGVDLNAPLPPADDRATNLANLLALSRAWSRARGAPERWASRKPGKWLPYLEPARLRR
ncbi:hypothetical protein [Nocardia brasiliensis]